MNMKMVARREENEEFDLIMCKNESSRSHALRIMMLPPW
jgi:hypothetical protein